MGGAVTVGGAAMDQKNYNLNVTQVFDNRSIMLTETTGVVKSDIQPESAAGALRGSYRARF